MGGFTSTAPVSPDGCAAFRPSFTNPTPFPGKPTVTPRALSARYCSGSRNAPRFFPKARTEFTGTPIRSTLRRIDRKEALEKLGLQPGIPTLLVMGGSQGASGINQAMIKSMPSLQELPLQVIHLSGSRDERLLADNYRRENIPALCRGVSSSDGRSLQRGRFRDRACRRGQPCRAGRFCACPRSSSLIPTRRTIIRRATPRFSSGRTPRSF